MQPQSEGRGRFSGKGSIEVYNRLSRPEWRATLGSRLGPPQRGPLSDIPHDKRCDVAAREFTYPIRAVNRRLFS